MGAAARNIDRGTAEALCAAVGKFRRKPEASIAHCAFPCRVVALVAPCLETASVRIGRSALQAVSNPARAASNVAPVPFLDSLASVPG